MNFLQSLVSRSHVGYTRLTETKSLHVPPIFWRILDFLGQCFHYMAYWASLALLPVTLLYLRWNNEIIPALLCILFLGILYQFQDKLLYHPEMPENSRLYVPSPPPSVPFEEIEIITRDKVCLHGYFIKQSEELLAEAPTFIYFHGNAGNVCSPSIMRLYTKCLVNILAIDYRGFGRSTGHPSEEGLYIDGESAVEYLLTRRDIDVRKIVLHGHSLGGAVAIHVASQCKSIRERIAAVVVENTFTSIPDVSRHMFGGMIPFIHFLPRVFFKNRFESRSKVHEIGTPVLFICGDHDEIVPAGMSRSLYTSARNPRSAQVSLPGGTHNDTWCVTPFYEASISLFLSKVFENNLTWTPPETSEEMTSLSWEWQSSVNHNRASL